MTRAWPRLLVVVPWAFAQGCIFFLDLDESRVRTPRDGGVPFDGGPVVEDCTTPGDEDGNGLADCADFACVGVAECCTPDNLPPPTVFDWSDLEGWAFVPGSDPRPPDVDVGNRRLIGFGVGDVPRALVREACVPLAVGLELRVNVIPQAGGLCASPPGGALCNAGLVLTAVRDMRPGSRLLEELAVRIDERGVVRATQGGVVLAEAEAPITFGQPARVEASVHPSLDAEGRPVLVADVAVTQATRRLVLLEGRAFVAQSNLVRDVAPCDDTPGLFVAIEGRGARVHVEPLTVQALGCANPGQFERPVEQGAPLTAASLGLGPWAAGGLGPPSLASSRGAEGAVRWDLLVDTTDADPGLEPITRVGRALDHAVAVGDGWDDGWTVRAGPTPKAGDCHPSCLGPAAPACAPITACPDPAETPSLREPFALPDLDAAGVLEVLRAAHALELDPVAERFGLVVYPRMRQAVEDALAVESPVLVPADLAGAEDAALRCTSLRDPALAPAEPDGVANPDHWLFFTCERDGAPDEIQAVRLGPSLTVVPGTQVRVVVPADRRVAPFGAGGVRAPEPLVALEPDGTGSLRLWYLARATPGAPATLAVSQGDLPKPGAGEPPRLPDPGALVPYPANPVLRADDRALGGCAGVCDLLGVAVAPRPDRAGRLRFLVARRLDVASVVTHELRPLEQAWRAP